MQGGSEFAKAESCYIKDFISRNAKRFGLETVLLIKSGVCVELRNVNQSKCLTWTCKYPKETGIVPVSWLPCSLISRTFPANKLVFLNLADFGDRAPNVVKQRDWHASKRVHEQLASLT